MPPKPNPPPGAPSPNTRHFIFLHPDLGIGGAERLVVDAALGLQSRGHRVTIFTSYRDTEHCFEETRDGTLDVRVRGGWLFPASVFSRLTIICAVLRQIHLLVQVWASGEMDGLAPDVFVVDQLSAGLPLLEFLWPKQGILFYCHFPDKLLARGRSGPLKALYRAPFDILEEWSTSYAHAIAVNSSFTKTTVQKHLPLLRDRDLRVVYPAIDFSAASDTTPTGFKLPYPDDKILLSINRFEQKKDIGLAIRAFSLIDPAKRKGARLVLAGGYDPRVPENVQYHKELQELCDELCLSHTTIQNPTATDILALPPVTERPVLFLLSIPTPLKNTLLRNARLLIYTPSHEHFGIVPLESMSFGVPVLACNNGGPVETVLDGTTGWLRDPEKVQDWSDVMVAILPDDDRVMIRRDMMAAAGKKRVEGFGIDTLASRLERIAFDLEDTPRRKTLFASFMSCLGIILVFLFGLGLGKLLL